MHSMKRLARALAIAATLQLLFAGGQTLQGQQLPTVFRAGYAGDQLKSWRSVKLATRANRFSVVDEDGASVLRIDSERSASALYYDVNRKRQQVGKVAWRWKIDRSLTGEAPERTKRGDDYAARFFVVFDGEPFSRTARAICYVWAASELVGSTYRNPYFSDVVTIVLESGNARRGKWVPEERDFIRDYKAAFGSLPESVSAIAVMVDTDNTRSRATAWFDVIIVKPPSQSESATPDN